MRRDLPPQDAREKRDPESLSELLSGRGGSESIQDDSGAAGYPAARVEASPPPAPPGGGGVLVYNSLGLSEQELQRRQLVAAKLGAQSPEERARVTVLEQQAKLAQLRDNAERLRLREAHERNRAARRPRQLHDFDPGPDPSLKPAAVRDRERARKEQEACDSARRVGVSSAEFLHEEKKPPRVRTKRRGIRPFKAPRRKPNIDVPSRILQFGRERAWTRERAQKMATRTKRNDAIIAHPRRAYAEFLKLTAYTQAAIRRAMRGQRWTFADEAGRRHVALWATLEDFSYAVVYSRPKTYERMGMPSRIRGIPRFGQCVRGWTQPALALMLSGAACTDAGADPIDTKTVQRHVELAEDYGGLRRVVRNPDAEPEFRGRPTESNPKGWPVNEYWVPSAEFRKPSHSLPTRDGQPVHFDSNGEPIGLAEALALELIPRVKRPRRLREQRASQAPPPIAS